MIKEFLIGTLVFVVVTLVLFQSSSEFGETYGTNTSTDYDYGVSEANAMMTSIAQKAPGGSEGSQGTGGDIETDTDLGFKTGAKIIGQGVPIFKNIIFGESSTGKEGVLTKLGIRQEFGTLLVASFLVIIALILISSLLRNVIK